MPGLGRLVAVDARDLLYPMSLALRGVGELPAPLEAKMWEPGPILDQGDTPHCVGYSWRQFITTAPPSGDADHPDGDEIYDLAQKNDEWAASPHDGSSVRGGAKALSGLGVLQSYLWAGNLEDLTQWLITKGPIVFGTNWYSSMFEPTDGVVQISGDAQIVGGHAYLCIGYEPASGQSPARYRFANSWGESWGDAGCFWMMEPDVRRLVFAEYGEACTAVEAAIAPLPNY